MISPLMRRVANTPTKSIVSRSTAAVINPSPLAQRVLPSIINFPFHQSSQNRASIPFQTVRMSSSNPANKNFTREHLFDCKGRVARGGSGIGLMITQALVANGAKVYITGRTEEKLERVVEKYSDGKDTIVLIPSDITSKEGIKKLVSEIESQESNGLHILVNNAGISGSTVETSAKSAEEAKKNLFDTESSTFEDWTDVYRTNKASESSPGWSSTVVNVTSISGLAAANQLTRMLANELTVGNGLLVRVNAIALRVFPSEMTAGESGRDQKSALPKEKFEEKIPAGRPGRDQDMAQAVLSLVCNQYVNDEIHVVDGAYTVAVGQ
ncbi:hypothetical protein F4782DRAFT_542504 [Xylaria castorea]|nr:hypothetical protein F4782DRAFT_542504 [Xylaria castorea]